MPSPPPTVLSRASFDAVIFDLDGVLTRTQEVHRRAWKQVFDAFLAERARQLGEPFRPFEDEDYRREVDGRPRIDGVQAFLASRGIHLPRGMPEDGPEQPTAFGLGHRKNLLFHQLLEQQGVQVFERSVALVHQLREAGFRTAVISASKNCQQVLRAARLESLFHARVDGVEQERLGLRGKPAPDVFLEAARQLGVLPERAVVVEDAIAGVEAGRSGGFGLVIGVDRSGHPEPLAARGADVVVPHLGLVRVEAAEGASSTDTREGRR